MKPSTLMSRFNGRTEQVRGLALWFAGSVLVWVVLAGDASAQTFRLVEATVTDVQAALASGQITCRELVQRYLDRVEAYDQTGPTLNAIQYVNPRALERAESLDATFVDGYALGNNRFLSPVVGFPAFTEAELLGLGYAYEQGTQRREPPPTTPALEP